MIVYDDAEALLAWAARRIGAGRFTDQAKAIGLKRDGALAAVAVFDLFQPWECELSFAAERHWTDRGFIRAVFAYPFRQLRLERLTCLVSARNRPARQLVRAMGFVPEGRKRRLHAEHDILIFGLLRSECRWVAPIMLAA